MKKQCLCTLQHSVRIISMQSSLYFIAVYKPGPMERQEKKEDRSVVYYACVCVTELIVNIHTACINYRQTTVFSWLFIHSASSHNVCDKALHISCFIHEHKIGSLSSVNKLVKLNWGKMCMLLFVLYIK